MWQGPRTSDGALWYCAGKLLSASCFLYASWLRYGSTAPCLQSAGRCSRSRTAMQLQAVSPSRPPHVLRRSHIRSLCVFVCRLVDCSCAVVPFHQRPCTHCSIRLLLWQYPLHSLCGWHRVSSQPVWLASGMLLHPACMGCICRLHPSCSTCASV